MLDNSKDRLNNIFFYGLYMDPDMLRKRGVVPRNPRVASVDDYMLRIGNNSTLLRYSGARTQGMVYSLNHCEIEKLYQGAGLSQYAPESILTTLNDEAVAALCYTLITPPSEQEYNPDYERKLAIIMRIHGLL